VRANPYVYSDVTMIRPKFGVFKDAILPSLSAGLQKSVAARSKATPASNIPERIIGRSGCR